MSGCGCKKAVRNEEKQKNRTLAKTLAEAEQRDYLLIEYDGKLYVESEECYIKGGRKGKIIEYFLV
jgi:hypothetical protein